MEAIRRLFGQGEEDTSPRFVQANGGVDVNPYCDNTMTNTKYTFFNFIPKNFAEQFRLSHFSLKKIFF